MKQLPIQLLPLWFAVGCLCVASKLLVMDITGWVKFIGKIVFMTGAFEFPSCAEHRDFWFRCAGLAVMVVVSIFLISLIYLNPDGINGVLSWLQSVNQASQEVRSVVMFFVALMVFVATVVTFILVSALLGTTIGLTALLRHLPGFLQKLNHRLIKKGR